MSATTIRVPVITVGVDGSAASERALHWATDYARATGASLHLITVDEAQVDYGDALLGWDSASPQHLLAAHTEAVATNKKAYASCPLPAQQVFTEVIVDTARLALTTASETSELLVVGNRGHREVTDLLLGSVSSYAVHHASCPVVVVP